MLHHIFSSWYLTPNFGSLTHTLKSIPYSEESCWHTNAWKYTATIREEMQYYLFCEMLLCGCFFCFVVGAAATLHLQAQIHHYQTWHLWCNSQTGKDGRSAIVHGSWAPLYAGAKPIIHVEICLGKLGSSLESKQPETGALHWCFRATLMSRRLMEALPRRHIAKASLFFAGYYTPLNCFQSLLTKWLLETTHTTRNMMLLQQTAVERSGIPKPSYIVTVFQIWDAEGTWGGESAPGT